MVVFDDKNLEETVVFNDKNVEEAVKQLTLITGQKAVVTHARKSIVNLN